MAHISKCVEDLLRKSMSRHWMVDSHRNCNRIFFFWHLGGKKPVEKHAAVWVPDNEASVCLHCKKTQFTMIVRRVRESSFHWLHSKKNLIFFSLPPFHQHHCRNCGAVVCGPCSSKKFLLPQQSTKPVRVCLNCYDSLSHTKTEQVRQSACELRFFFVRMKKKKQFNFVP